jgi:hypothetical protein
MSDTNDTTSPLSTTQTPQETQEPQETTIVLAPDQAALVIGSAGEIGLYLGSIDMKRRSGAFTDNTPVQASTFIATCMIAFLRNEEMFTKVTQQLQDEADKVAAAQKAKEPSIVVPEQKIILPS